MLQFVVGDGGFLWAIGINLERFVGHRIIVQDIGFTVLWKFFVPAKITSM